MTSHKRTGSLAGLLAAAFVTLSVWQLMPGPQPPPTTLPPAGQPGASVQADDELPGSAPYHRTMGRPPSAPPQPDRALAIARPETAGPAAKRQAGKYIVVNNITYPLRTYKPLAIPNDPSAAQWWVTQAKLDQLWDVPAGSYQTTLAIIDTGFALQHEEFAGRWHVNTGESGPAASEQASALNCSDRGLPLSANCNLIDDDADGTVDNESGAAVYQNPSRRNCTDQGKPLTKDCNRIDDDANGYTDDVSGWDFANNDNLPQAGELNPAGSGTTHGTRVAGIAAATGNNAKGLAGADWHTKLLPIQALDDDAYGDTWGVGRAISYAVSQGADVISLSLGSDLPDAYVREVVSEATAAGIVVVAASGNDGCDCMVYPANYPEVVAVGALTSSNLPASFSSYGANLDILAPGSGLTTSSWTAANPTAAYAAGVSGTSYATPLAAGILTRLLSSRPEATPLQLIAALTETTNRLSLAAGTPRSNTLGYGTADAQQAMARLLTARQPAYLYEFAPASLGRRLSPGDPAETAGSYRVQQCEPGTAGTTPIYELSRAGGHFFSISPTEAWRAQQAGYSSSLFAHACLQQPHDSAASVRTLNLFKEFRNLQGDHAFVP